MFKEILDFKNEKLKEISNKYNEITKNFENKKISKDECVELLQGLQLETDILEISTEIENKNALYEIITGTIKIIQALAIIK